MVVVVVVLYQDIPQLMFQAQAFCRRAQAQNVEAFCHLLLS